MTGTAEAKALYESFKAGGGTSNPVPGGVRKSFSEGNIKLFARTTSIEMARTDLPTLAEEDAGTNGDSRQGMGLWCGSGLLIFCDTLTF